MSRVTVTSDTDGFETVRVDAGTVNVFSCHESVRKNPWADDTCGSVPFFMVPGVFPVVVGG